MNYGFYVSGSATRLKLFLSLQEKYPDIKSKVSFVLIDNTQNSELSDLCKQFKIPFYQYSYKELQLVKKDQNKFISDKLSDLLDETGSSCCFVFGGRILEGKLLERYKNKLINFHPSILPAYKGIAAIDQALADKALVLGNTAHIINADLDAGAIIMQSFLASCDFKNYDTVMDMQVPMMFQIVKWIENNRFTVNDNRVTIKDASYKFDSYIPNLEI